MTQFPSFPLAAFGPYDWGILGAYLLAMLLIGVIAAWRERHRTSTTEEFFLAGRSMPTWALAISIVGASLSAATFIGAPDQAYVGNLTYLIFNIGNFIAVFVVGFVFVPRLYRAGTVTIYGYLAQRYGEGARIAVSMTFIVGRMLASGARLMVVAVPLCMLVWSLEAGQVTKTQMVIAICVVGLLGTFYTVFGGIKAVIWVDLAQMVLVVGAAVLTVGILLHRIPASATEIASALKASNKMQVVDLSLDARKPFTLWTSLTGAMLIMMAALGVDQDMAQRFLIAKSPARGAVSVIASQFVSIAVVSLFMLIGLLLYIFYQRPDVMGGAVHFAYPIPSGPSCAVYQSFLLHEMPPIASGLAITGLFAVARGSLDSAINALASSVIADLYLPIRRMRGDAVDSKTRTQAPKLAVAGMGALLTLVAVVCAILYDPKEHSFLEFALGVMTFAFSGMLAVFLAALLTRRGNSASVIAALATGASMVAMLQDAPVKWFTGRFFGASHGLAFPWVMLIATAAAFAICIAGDKPRDARGFPVDR